MVPTKEMNSEDENRYIGRIVALIRSSDEKRFGCCDGRMYVCSALCATCVSMESVARKKESKSQIMNAWKWGCDNPQAFFESEWCWYNCVYRWRGQPFPLVAR